MFGFALWDRRRKRLLLARDRLGKKPLFYARRGSSLWFGSELKAILQDPSVPRDVDFNAIDSFLHYTYVPHDLSAFRSIRKLPPAHTLSWSDGHVETSRYWKLAYTPKTHTSEEELRESLRARLLEATSLRLRSDVPLGAFLSGGVDSSAVVAAMAKTSSSRLRTFSIGFRNSSFDETPYAREVAELFDTDHHEFVVEADMIELLPKLVWHYGEPFADQSALPTFILSRLARQHVTVALNGDGGDEIFAGYRRYYAHHLAGRLKRIPPGAAEIAARLVERLGSGGRPQTVRDRLRRLLRSVPMARNEQYATWIASFAEAERQAIYTDAFREAIGEPYAQTVIRDPYEASDADTDIDRLLDVDVQTYLPGDLLVKVDIASMAYSLEVRSPLLDHTFMEFAATLPAETKLDGRRSKRLFKEALRPWLPDRILNRKKQGFTVPLGEWLRGELRDLPGEVLLDPATLDRGMFTERGVRSLIADHQNGVNDNTSKLWTLIQLELWLRCYCDGSPTAPPTLSRPTSTGIAPERGASPLGLTSA
jgi:asparagine synthase (glutamine-hydrolysing)